MPTTDGYVIDKRRKVMPDDDSPSEEHAGPPERAADTPKIEDAYAPTTPAPESALTEDEPELLDRSSRALKADLGEAEQLDEASAAEAAARSAQAAEKDDTSDADSIPDDTSVTAEKAEDHEQIDWDNELSTHTIVVELKRIENEIRRLLNGRDQRRKRKLGGTRRWLDLEADILFWRHTSRIDEATLIRLQALTARRHHLFGRLRFLAGTRPVWNS